MSSIAAKAKPRSRRPTKAESASARPQQPWSGTSEDFQELVQSFNETAQKLQATHEGLQQQVARLQKELAEANAALSRSQALAALGEMAAGIAHEVRNPLASIQLYVQMLTEDVSGHPQQVQLCDKIKRAVIGLDAVVRDVLSFARDTQVHPQHLSVADLFHRAISMCETLIRSSDVQVILSPPMDDCLTVHADPVLMTQAVANVVRNAVEALSETESSIRQLRLSADHKRMRLPDGSNRSAIELVVQDNGPGISEEVIGRIFNPFFTTRKTGTGLGLAIVHRIVDAHGGHVNIRNVPPPSRGTQVDICLPSTP